MVVASNFTMMKSQEFIFSSTPVLHGVVVVVVAQVLTATAATNIRVVVVAVVVVVVAYVVVVVVVVRNATLRRHEVTPLKRNPVVK